MGELNYITVDTEEQLQFLKDAVNHVCDVYDKCDLEHLYRLKDIIISGKLGVNGLAIGINDEQTEGFRSIMKLYNDLSADFVTWSDEFLKKLPEETKDALTFKKVLDEHGLNTLDSLRRAQELFNAWVAEDHFEVQFAIVNIIKYTGDKKWLDVYEWCNDNAPCSDTDLMDEVNAYARMIRG